MVDRLCLGWESSVMRLSAPGSWTIVFNIVFSEFLWWIFYWFLTNVFYFISFAFTPSCSPSTNHYGHRLHDDIAFQVNSPTQAKSLLHSQEREASGIGLYVNTDKTEYMCFNQRGNISTLKGGPLKLVDKFTYLGSSISSTKNDINVQVAKTWTAIDRLSVICKSDLTDKIKQFFPSSVHVDTAIWMHHTDTN